MISNTKFYLILCFLITLGHNSFSQKTNKRVAKADQAFALEEYYKAAELYKKAYEKTKSRSLKSEIIFKQAECYRLSGNIKRAENYYKRAIKAKYPDVIAILRYGDVLRMNQKYDEALEQYQKYVQLNPTDVRGEIGVKSCNYSIEWLSNPTRYKVELMPIINSRYSDFSPSFGNGDYSEIYFTSSRKGGFSDKIDDRTGESFTDIYLTKLDKKNKWSAPQIVGEPISGDGNEGSVALNFRGTTMYLTKCKVEKKKSLGCRIYISKRNGQLWSDPQPLQVKLDSNTSIGHPSISNDEKTLIFSSDMKGGYGGKDLWIVKKEKRNKWSKPVNLGPAVNTSANEMFPFLHEDGSLYFSSNGHIGMGGHDIFKTAPDENEAYSSVINLKFPVNSSSDDFGMIIESDGERGYFTSNRKGGKGSDDVYAFELPPLVIFAQGVVTDSKTGAILTDATIKFVASDGSEKDIKTDNSGAYKVRLKPLTSYEIIAFKNEFLKNIKTETTHGIENDKTILLDFELDPVKKEIILPRIEYDFAKFDLREKSKQDLDMLVTTLNDNPDVKIELKSHTDFIGSNIQNKRLSQKRADECVRYLTEKGISKSRITALGMGESEPYVIEQKDGNLKVGDVLTESYIKKMRFRKNRDKANQYNRRTTFKVLIEDTSK